MTFVVKLLLAGLCGLFRRPTPFVGDLKPLFPGPGFSAELRNRFAFTVQCFDCLSLRELRVSDLGLKIPHDILCVGKRAFRPFARRGFGGQSGLGSL